jgi:hypothetical protein
MTRDIEIPISRRRTGSTRGVANVRAIKRQP